MYSKSVYMVRRNSREIVHTEIVSNRLVGHLTEDAVGTLIDDGAVQWYLNEEGDALMPVSGTEIRSLWERRVRGHVANQTEDNTDDYTHGYFFFAELWHGAGGGKIIVLQYHH